MKKMDYQQFLQTKQHSSGDFGFKAILNLKETKTRFKEESGPSQKSLF